MKHIGKRPVWSAMQAAGTKNESNVLDPYKAIIGISGWEEIMHEVNTSTSEKELKKQN